MSRHFVILKMAVGLLCLSGTLANAQSVSISESGTPAYSMPISVPPGIAGMAPNIGLQYSGSGVNGPVGYGWTLQGISIITRCANVKAIDGNLHGVDYTGADKLCLDGQRLIQTDASGSIAAYPFPQTNDSLGGTGMVREYRTEKDTYARIRAYDMANGLAGNGPAYFKVWTKSGQIYEYGNNANASANAAIAITGKTAISAWAVSRISDTLGNYMDFQYEQRDIPWGSGPTAGSPISGHEWNLQEIRYTGTPTQPATNKVVFENLDRSNTAGVAQDSSEAYHQGAKNVSMRRLNAVRTYINITGTPLKVKTTKLTYTPGTLTNRSLVTQIQECVGAAETQCLPPTVFNYSTGGGEAYVASTAFNLGTLTMQNAAGSYGVINGNFMGTGRTDIIRWSDNPAENQLYKSNGDGSFNQVPSGAGAGQFNITDQNLFKSDGCYSTIAADFNGDGVSDLLRIAKATSSSGAACPTPLATLLYMGKGDGSFWPPTTISGIDFTQTTSKFTDAYDCLRPLRGRYIPTGCIEPGNNYLGSIQSSGANFYLMDVNGDGLMDIVTTILPGFALTTSPPNDATLCATIVCTHVYLADGLGGFVEQVNTNLTHRSVYADPPGRYDYMLQKPPHVVDVNGDGLADLSVNNGVWLSHGDQNGTFDSPVSSTAGCYNPIDVNGDGRTDCIDASIKGLSYQSLRVSDGTLALQPSANFNLVSAGQELYGINASAIANVGMVVADFNGDGRQDILRWKDDATQNALYLSNGDGTFSPSTTFNLGGTTPVQLQSSDGLTSFLVGDFRGRGNVEMMRLKSNPTAGAATANQLYVKVDATPPDQLQSVVSGTGRRTDLTWVPLTNSVNPASPALGARYTVDPGAGLLQAYTKVDLNVPMQVVASSITDGVTTEYSYSGLKAAYDGRGSQGFHQTRRQMSGPNGQNLTVVTQYLQDHPYTGVASNTSTYLGTLNATSANAVSSSDFIYCEMSAGTPASATPTAPCPVPATTKVQRPYLYKGIDNARELTAPGNDVLSSAFNTVTTQNTYNSNGDPTSIQVITTGAVLGTNQTVTKTNTNTYQSDDMSGDNWILGRLATASQAAQSINLLGSMTPSAGSAAQATSTVGFAATPPSISANPTSISAASFAPTPASGVVTFTNSGQTPTTLNLSLTGGSSLSTSTLSCPANGSCGSVTVTSPSVAGTYNGALTMSSTLEGTVPSVPVSLTVQSSSTLSVSPASLVTALYGSSVVTVTNAGPTSVSAITESIVQTSGADIGSVSTLNDTCVGHTLASGASCTLTVAFQADCSLVGTSNWTLSITGAGAANTAVFGISGRASAALCKASSKYL